MMAAHLRLNEHYGFRTFPREVEMLDQIKRSSSLEFEPRRVYRLDGVLRWRPNKLALWMMTLDSGINLNLMYRAFQRGEFSLPEYEGFYRDLGYTLCRYVEVFEDLWRKRERGLL